MRGRRLKELEMSVNSFLELHSLYDLIETSWDVTRVDWTLKFEILATPLNTCSHECNWVQSFQRF